MNIVPLTLRQANAFISAHHRHAGPTRGHRFSVGLNRGDELVGVAVAGRPVARGLEALAEVEKEGLDISPPFTPRLFCEWWALEHGYSRVEFDSDSIHCRRIEWRYLDEVDR